MTSVVFLTYLIHLLSGVVLGTGIVATGCLVYQVAKLVPHIVSHLKAWSHNRKLLKAERKRQRAEAIEREKWSLPASSHDPNDPKSLKQLADDLGVWLDKQQRRMQEQRAKQEKEDQKYLRRHQQ